MSIIRTTCVFAIAALLLSSCANYFGGDGRREVSSSLVDYLYPDGEVPKNHDETTPLHDLPLTAGLAFVPSQRVADLMLPEAKKMQLLEAVKQKFVWLDCVKEIVIVPDTYMRSSMNVMIDDYLTGAFIGTVTELVGVAFWRPIVQAS